MDKHVQITLAIVGGFLLLGFMGFILVSSVNSPYGDDTISVNGLGIVDATPDLVIVYFNIQTEATTSQEASESNTEIYNQLVSSLIALGFSEEEIQTQSYSVNPNYDWERGGIQNDGFIATHSVKVEFSVEERDKVSEVIDAGINSGAGINYISFELSKELQDEYKAEAIELAGEDATLKASAVANGLDKRVGRLVSVSLDDYYYYPFKAYESSSRGDGASASSDEILEAVDINPSDQEVSARVTAVFKII